MASGRMAASFDEHVLQEISSACVDTKLRGIEAISTVREGATPHKLAFPVRATKPGGGDQ